MANPSIDELQNSGQFELIAELKHSHIKEFVLQQISKGGKLVLYFMLYQGVMLMLGIFLIVSSIFQAYRSDSLPLILVVLSAVFCFTILIIIHELLHGMTIKVTGAPKVNYGYYLKRFIFYAEADCFVMNKKQFTLVALAPFMFIKILTAVGTVLFLQHPMMYFFLFVMSAHSMFCAGDIGLLSMFYRDNGELYTFDVKSEKKSYYYRKLDRTENGSV